MSHINLEDHFHRFRLFFKDLEDFDWFVVFETVWFGGPNFGELPEMVSRYFYMEISYSQPTWSLLFISSLF